jgi:hypothetical protein
MLESINTLLLTLSQSHDRDRADSLRPKEFKFDRTTHLGFTAIAHQLGLFLPWLRSCCGKSRDSTETCLSERPSGSTTSTIVRDFWLCSRLIWLFPPSPFSVGFANSFRERRQQPCFHPDAHPMRIERGASHELAKGESVVVEMPLLRNGWQFARLMWQSTERLRFACTDDQGRSLGL